MHFQLNTLQDTQALAHYLIDSSQAGDLLILSGPLGAGKTTLTQAIGRLLASPAHISSPTYTLIHEYPSPAGLLVHIDAYRLENAQSLLELGLEDYLSRARLVIVEWGEALQDYFPEAKMVKLYLEGTDRRAELSF